MPIIGKPLLVLGSLAGVSLLSVGVYLGASALDSQQSTLPNSESGNTEEREEGNGLLVSGDSDGQQKNSDSNDTTGTIVEARDGSNAKGPTVESVVSESGLNSKDVVQGGETVDNSVSGGSTEVVAGSPGSSSAGGDVVSHTDPGTTVAESQNLGKEGRTDGDQSVSGTGNEDIAKVPEESKGQGNGTQVEVAKNQSGVTHEPSSALPVASGDNAGKPAAEAEKTIVKAASTTSPVTSGEKSSEGTEQPQASESENTQ